VLFRILGVSSAFRFVPFTDLFVYFIYVFYFCYVFADWIGLDRIRGFEVFSFGRPLSFCISNLLPSALAPSHAIEPKRLSPMLMLHEEMAADPAHLMASHSHLARGI
jgi:hypothetical protein